jgi:selenide,water dikinase
MSELAHVLRHLLPVDDAAALVDASTGDDAAVYLLDEGRALVVTVDFFTPIVDDPAAFGRIGAANALSDLYAMGARPLFALNLVGFPRKYLDRDLLSEIIRGGSEKAQEAGIPILGGHSIDDPEPKFGMVAIGEVDPEALVTNRGAQHGDRLVLTKPLCAGVVSTAIKKGAADPGLVARSIEVMSALNRGAAEAMQRIGVSAATDVTGYGLLGHLRNLLHASGAAARIDADSVPVLDGVRELVAEGHVPGGTERNLADLAEDVDFGSLDPDTRTLLADAQTSGGLLIAVPRDRTDALLAELEGNSPVAAVIGEVVDGRPGHVLVR